MRLAVEYKAAPGGGDGSPQSFFFELWAMFSQRSISTSVQKYKRAIEAAWSQLNQSKPAPEIFWAFIDAERHNIVHEYEVGAGQGVTVHMGQNTFVEHHYLVNTGPFAGRDQRDVLREAFAWWEAYLDGIDHEATQ